MLLKLGHIVHLRTYYEWNVWKIAKSIGKVVMVGQDYFDASFFLR
ncbi:unnamed protein product, partial [marine sediment metagenome]